MTWKQRCEDAERRVSIAERELAKAGAHIERLHELLSVQEDELACLRIRLEDLNGTRQAV